MVKVIALFLDKNGHLSVIAVLPLVPWALQQEKILFLLIAAVPRSQGKYSTYPWCFCDENVSRVKVFFYGSKMFIKQLRQAVFKIKNF